jgi:cytochrome oxidase assembly protein ShyY1
MPPTEWQRVEVRGSWLAQNTIFIDNRVYRGRAGYHVITPLQIEGEERVIAVNRGWIPAGATRDVLPEVSTSDAIVSVLGRARLAESDPFRLGESNEAGVVWQSINLPRLRANVPALADYYLQQTSVEEDGLVRDWPAPDAGIDRHHGYALQWYALAALAAGLTAWYAFFEIRRTRRDKRNID